VLDEGDDAEREIEGPLLDEREILAPGDVVAPDIEDDFEDDVDDEVEDGEEEVLATFGTTGSALIASDGIRMPGVTFGETGRSLSGLESLCVGTLWETARCNAPREAIDPPRSTISCRERFASVSVMREREPVVDAERDMSADWVELNNVDDCDDVDRADVDCGDDEDVDCGDDEDETARC
jgi:hypothetical protein